MGFFHLANCLALATGPHVLVYKSTGMNENDAFWRCCKIGILYGLTQLFKFFLATLTPYGDHPINVNSINFEVFGAVVELIVIYLIVCNTGRNEFSTCTAAMGWSLSSLVSTKYLPLWFGTRGLEFDWAYLRLSYEANLEMVWIFVTFYSVWLLTRKQGSLSSSIQCLVVLLVVALKSVLYSLLANRLESALTILIVKTFITLQLGLGVLILRSIRREDNYEYHNKESTTKTFLTNFAKVVSSRLTNGLLNTNLRNQSTKFGSASGSGSAKRTK